MNLESLKIFRNVVESGGFSKAISRSHMSQSAISKQIQNLEASVGQRLFNRTTRSLQLTPAGKLLYERSERIIGELEETRQILRNFEGKLQSQLSIGTTASIGISYFPGIFTNFTKHNPHCRLTVRSEFSPILLRQVEQRELDCAVVCLPPNLPKNIRVSKTFMDPLILVASHDFIQKQKNESPGKKPLQILAKEPLILIGAHTYTRKIIDHFLFEKGLTVYPSMELDSFDLIVSFVALGLGISIVPQRVLPVYARSRSISCGKLANLPIKRQLGIVIHKSNEKNELLKEFIRHFSF